MEIAAKGVCARREERRRGGDRSGGVQSRDDKDRALQQVARDRDMPIR